MASVQVDALGLRLIAPGTLERRVPALQREAGEVFVPAVLRAMERRLARVYGERAVICIRRLSIRCALRPSEFATSAYAAQLGEELAAQIAATVPHPRQGASAPPPHPIAEIYLDAAHMLAVALVAAAEGRPGPGEMRESFAEVWTRAACEPPALRRQLLRRCHAAGKLDTVLARLDIRALTTLEPLVATDRSAAIATAVRAAIARRMPETQAPSAQWTGTADEPAAASLLPREPAPSAGTASVPRKTKAAGRGRKSPLGSGHPETQSAKPVPLSLHPDVPAEPRDAGTAAPVEDSASPADSLPRNSPEEAPRSTRSAAPEDAAHEPAMALSQRAYTTGWARLLFLLNIALRLDLPERLWRIGVDEGAVLAAAFARLAGTMEDCAPRLLHAAFPAAPPTTGPLPQWARDELGEVAREGASHLLGSDVDPGALTERIALLEAQFSPDGFELASWCAALLLACAESMLGTPLAPGTLAEPFAAPGRILLDGDTIRVVLPMEAVDLDLRRAGLDGDPGLLVWLSKRLVFEFEGGEA